MWINMSNEEDIPADSDAYFEKIACQEEIYLEETEEELRAILVFESPTPSQNVDEQPEQAAEGLITGDADDPPLSDDAVTDMLKPS